MMLMKNIIYCCFIFCAALFSQNISSNKIKQDTDNTEYFEMLDKVFNKISANYVDSINSSEIIVSGIKGLFSPLDPYSKFLTGRGKENLDILRTGKYGGVGIKIGLVKDTLTVISVYEESPAYSEGIFPADQILKIDSTSTEKLSVRDASSLIKGEMGTKVTFHLYRPSAKSKFSIDLMRAQIKVKHLPYFGIDDNGVGYIRLTKFSKNSSKDFKTALNVMNNNKRIYGSNTKNNISAGKGLLLQLSNPAIIEEVKLESIEFLDEYSEIIPLNIFELDSASVDKEFDVFTDLPSESIFLSKDRDTRGNIRYLNIWYNAGLLEFVLSGIILS